MSETEFFTFTPIGEGKELVLPVVERALRNAMPGTEFLAYEAPGQGEDDGGVEVSISGGNGSNVLEILRQVAKKLEATVERAED